jgi:hypothetical protein
MGQEEASSSSKCKALACSEKKKMKGKQVETSSSSSSSSEDEEDEDDDDDESSDDDQSSSSTSDIDEESLKIIKKVEKMIQWLNVKGVPIQVQDCIFTNQRREQRKKGCYGCGKKGHFVEVCPNKPTPKTKKKARKAKHQPLPQSRLGMIHQVKIKPNTRGAITSTSHVCLIA